MVITETIRNKWTRSYSDEGFFIAPVEEPEVLYIDAIDPINSGREYIETEVPIPEEEDEESL